jgi:hypothetical protein
VNIFKQETGLCMIERGVGGCSCLSGRRKEYRYENQDRRQSCDNRVIGNLCIHNLIPHAFNFTRIQELASDLKANFSFRDSIPEIDFLILPFMPLLITRLNGNRADERLKNTTEGNTWGWYCLLVEEAISSNSTNL